MTKRLLILHRRSRGSQNSLSESRKVPIPPYCLVFPLLLSLTVVIACGSASRYEVSMPDPTSLEKDLRAIDALNQRDMKAVLAGDTAALVAQWTDDFVALPPAGPILRGRRANAEVVERGMEQRRAIEPVEYVVDFEEIKVLGEYAFEWGTYRGSMRPRAGGETVSYGGKLIRILQRQPDGSWKMYRTMITSDPPAR